MNTPLQSTHTIKPSLKGSLEFLLIAIAFPVGLIICLIWGGFPELMKGNPSVTPYIVFTLFGIAPFFLFLWQLLCLSQTSYKISEQEVKIERKVLSTLKETITIEKINSVQLRQHVLEQILGIGTIVLTTSSNERITLQAINDPHDVAERICAIRK